MTAEKRIPDRYRVPAENGGTLRAFRYAFEGGE